MSPPKGLHTQSRWQEPSASWAFPSRKSYVEVLRAFAGAYGDAEFPFPGSEASGSIGLWLSPVPWERESLWTSVSTWQEHELPESIVPIAEDGGGNLLCLDYRHSHAPAVVFWFHELAGEEGLRRVAPSFEAFITTLREGEA